MRLIHGEALAELQTLPDESVNCCVTSPPYYGLRDYGVDGQIGHEKTPQEYVQRLVDIFREVRRVLRDDGTLWLNLGDSYNKKNLIGIPWLVAFALQRPYYAGPVKDESDRVWLAAILDAEGCITASEYETDGKQKTNIYISITNSAMSIIDKCERLFPQEAKHIYEKSGNVNRTVYRWDVERIDKKALFIREVYPYVVAKRKQAILGFTFLELQRGLPSKKKGYLPEQGTWLVNALSNLNQGNNVDIPDWVVEPPPLFEPGFYLRQDIIWAKPNPMTESVTDRCTRAHEYIFLLSKNMRYYYDQNAIKEKAIYFDKDQGGSIYKDSRSFKGKHSDKQRGHSRRHAGFNNRWDGMTKQEQCRAMRNKRSVWIVATSQFKDAHFAVFPPDLIRPMILAGCPPGGVVLDPFVGSGTTALVCLELDRDCIGIDLNPAYIEMAKRRLAAVPPRLPFGVRT